jgi:hypothetical protein
LLAFLIGVTAAVALGGFDPLARFTHSYSRHHHYVIPPQSLQEDGTGYESYRGCRHARPHTAELPYQYDSSIPPVPPDVPDAPVFDRQVPPPPPSPLKAARANR